MFIESELKLDAAPFLIKFKEYENALLAWNKKINLISRKSTSVEEHILNSIFFLTKFELRGISKIADVGTGGGFPGIPLKILFPDVKVLLVDSIKKKIIALEDIVRKIKLKGTEPECGRAEEISVKENFRHQYDAVISKSVAATDKIFKWSNKFLKTNGALLCIKGGDIDNEIESLRKMNYNLHIQILCFDYQRYGIEDKKLVIIKSVESMNNSPENK